MKTSMIIHFDSEQTRAAFFEDIGELIFWNDNERDDDDRCDYKSKTSYAFPDLGAFADSDSSLGSLNYSMASDRLRSTCRRIQSSKN